MQKHTLVAFLTVVVVAGALAFVSLRSSRAPVATTTSASEATPAPAALPAPAPAAAMPAPPPSRHRADAPGNDFDEQPETLAEHNEKVQKALRELDEKFQAEPVDPQWALPREQMIAASFSPEALKAKAAPTPVKHEESCRSNTCRIRVTYKSLVDSQVGQLNLLASISPTLSHADFGQIDGEDGSVQMVVFATAGGPGPPSHRR